MLNQAGWSILHVCIPPSDPSYAEALTFCGTMVKTLYPTGLSHPSEFASQKVDLHRWWQIGIAPVESLGIIGASDVRQIQVPAIMQIWSLPSHTKKRSTWRGGPWLVALRIRHRNIVVSDCGDSRCNLLIIDSNQDCGSSSVYFCTHVLSESVVFEEVFFNYLKSRLSRNLFAYNLGYT